MINDNVSRETIELYGYPDLTSFEWISTMMIEHSHMMTKNLTWDSSQRGDNSIVLMKCRCGRIASLVDHHIDTDGRVTPSVVCMNDDCDFHEFVILVDEVTVE